MLLLATGCYSYTTLDRTELAPGRELRARLNEQGTEWFDELTGDQRDAVEGSLVRTTPDALVLAVWRADLPNQIRFQTGRDTLRLPNAYVASLERRQFSYVKTGLLAAVAAVGFYFLVDGLSGGGSGDPGDNGQPLFLRIPLDAP